MNIEEQMLTGLKAGVDRHWRYTKELLHIKPEYLLTVAVADALTDGFGNFRFDGVPAGAYVVAEQPVPNV